MRVLEFLAAEVGAEAGRRVDQRRGVAGTAQNGGRERAGRAGADDRNIRPLHRSIPRKTKPREG